MMQASFRGRSNFFTEDTAHSKGELFAVRFLPRGIQDLLLPLVDAHESVYSVGKVSYNGTWYSKELAVMVDIGYKFAISWRHCCFVN